MSRLYPKALIALAWRCVTSQDSFSFHQRYSTLMLSWMDSHEHEKFGEKNTEKREQ